MVSMFLRIGMDRTFIEAKTFYALTCKLQPIENKWFLIRKYSLVYSAFANEFDLLQGRFLPIIEMPAEKTQAKHPKVFSPR